MNSLNEWMTLRTEVFLCCFSRQLSLDSAAPEECLRQSGSVYAGGDRRLLHLCHHKTISGNITVVFTLLDLFGIRFAAGHQFHSY